MKQVININFQGSVIPIETSAYEMLKNYINSLTQHFAAEDGKEEIINDIESRIAELFQERLKTGATCIVDNDVQAIMNSIGRPEDLAGDDENTTTKQTNTQQNYQQSTNTNLGGKKRLFRDENHKLVGGVCSGIANYFDIDIVIVRIIFLVLIFSFGIGFIPYIILWIAVPSSAIQVIGSRRKKLYRDLDEKYLGGVCSGIANYFGINVWIPRLIFLLPMLSLVGGNNWDSEFGIFPDIIRFSPGTFFIYIILWLVLPEAKTTTEKLEMKGEKVDMNTIKESVVEEIKGVQVRAQKFGKEVIGVAADKSKVFGSEATTLARKSSRSLGDIIVLLIKIFAYFIIGVVGIALVLSLFSGGIFAIRYFGLKDFMITDGTQNLYAWGVLIFFILAPMIGIITWIIRKITKVKAGSKMLRLSFISMWVLGWLSVALLGNSLSTDFKYSANVNEQNILLTNPNVKSLEITNHLSNARFLNNRVHYGNIFENMLDDDSLSIRHVTVQIVKSLNDSFKVTSIKLASGSTRAKADNLASQIKFNAFQQDSSLVIEDAITINKTDKFRNQRVVLTVYVPVGKRIKINGHVGRVNTVHFNGPFSINNNYDEFDNISLGNVENGWEEGTWYTMTNEGLVSNESKAKEKLENGVKINENGIDIHDGDKRVRIDEDGVTVDENTNNNENSGTYRYNNNTNADSIKLKFEQAEQAYKDSIKKLKEKIDKQVSNSSKTETSMLIKMIPTNLLVGVM
jgi:phage shock protein PspC (stress-responsive transcriptional regulator)